MSSKLRIVKDAGFNSRAGLGRATTDQRVLLTAAESRSENSKQAAGCWYHRSGSNHSATLTARVTSGCVPSYRDPLVAASRFSRAALRNSQLEVCTHESVDFSG